MNDWPLPTVYEGLYNGLSRKIEGELFPAIRQLGISFYAYNPMAGGMLSGKHLSYENTPPPGRFARLGSYRERYWKKSYFEAINNLSNVCRVESIEPAEAAYQWLAYHSMLDAAKGDGIIIGASSITQFKQNINSINKGTLPEIVVTAFNEAWAEAEQDSPEYYRYST